MDKDLDNPPKKDDDPDGFKLLSCADPLEQASRLVQPLARLSTTCIDAWIACYDVAIRRSQRLLFLTVAFLAYSNSKGKLLQAVSALNHASAINVEHAELHVRLVDVKLRAAGLAQQSPAPIGPIFIESLSKLVPDSVPLEKINWEYFQRHRLEGTAVLGVARVLKMLESPVSEVEKVIFGLLDEGVDVDFKVS